MDAFLCRAINDVGQQLWVWNERNQSVSIELPEPSSASVGIARRVRFNRGKTTTAASGPRSAWQRITHLFHKEEDDGHKSVCTILLTTRNFSREAIIESDRSVPVAGAADGVPLLPLAAHGVLMSCLQKAIRLRETACALRLVYTIASQPTPELIVKLLRRLPIILVEDAVVHPLFASLVYLMLLASPPRQGERGIVGDDGDDDEEEEEEEEEHDGGNDGTFRGLTHSQLSLVLRVVQDVCGPRIPAERRCLGYVCREEEEEEADANEPVLDPVEATLLVALAVRGGFGGMGCDMEMLGDAFLVWRERFRAKATPTYWKDLLLSSDKMVSSWSLGGQDATRVSSWCFTARDQLSTAIDHHCSNILTRLPQTFAGMAPTDIPAFEKLLWDRRSSVYRRICCCPPAAQRRHIFSAVDVAQDPVWWVRLYSTGFLEQFCRQTWQYRMRFQPTPQPPQKKLSRKRILAEAITQLTAPPPPPKLVRITDFFARPKTK